MRGAARHCVACAIAVKKRFLSNIVRRSASHAVLDALRPLRGHCASYGGCEISWVCVRLKAPFRPSATDFEGSK
ncbi:Asp-tRNAAsn/Glu-tRNAGln amidotransferase A subunit or related amidase [Pseudomonas syringae pv. actinidiae]|uniref:Asp-tRNAAsn/Glu-tRNAGln amidotransferase A subunit or related amidase n=1 Tax=Pseudomonas syringae pv. actinidiae TaxID=103796 RepID=A0AAN4Q3R6_PSESF|nr:Asp-tRNAAsn/Glu-tRNAGln amidotransferase A subunit or related amidase [Pseudomonas syringae pv. actinidiae]